MKNEKEEHILINWFLDRPKVLGLLVFVSLSIVFNYIAYQQYLIDKENKRVEMSNTLDVITQNIDQSLKNCYTTTLSLALIIDENGIPQDFNVIGKRLLESNSSINAVQMVPNGIIEYTYPLEGNEAALGLDILNSKLFKEEAIRSIENQKMYFAGPFELTQGGQGIVGRLPVYLKNKFWGFSAVIIRLDKLLTTSGINSLNDSKFDFQISKKNPITNQEEYFLPQQEKIKKNNFVSSYIPDGDWNLYIIDKQSTILFNKLIYYIFFGLLIAFMFGFFTYLLLLKPKQLKVLVYEQSKKLIENELRFKTLFEQATIGIANVDIDSGNFIEINDYFCNLLGYSKEEMCKKNFQSITHPDDLKRDLDFVEKISKGEINQYSMEKRYFTKENKLVWVNLTVASLFSSKENKEKTLLSIVQDITENKNKEKIILDNKLQKEALINTINGIVWECDAATFAFTFVSKKVEHILGYTSEEWLSSKTFWEDHIYHEDKNTVLSFCKERTAEKLDHDFEYRMIAKNGEIVWLRDIVNVVIDDNKVVSLRGIMIDITKNKAIQNDLNNSFNLVSEQNKRLLNFSHIVSHNLRSHASNISSLIGVIEFAESDVERKEMFELLKNVSDALNDTLTNLNEVVNIQTNINLTTEKINLRNYIEVTLKVLSDQIKLSHVTINNWVDENVSINYNRAYLESILFNIISNSIRYRDTNKESVIDIRFTTENDDKILEISDNGIGIDLEKNKGKIFGMYKTFSNYEDSKGIGLFITKNQVEAMGGTILVESEPNVGTTFKIYIL